MSAGPETAAKSAVATPWLRKNSFSLTRSWATARGRLPGAARAPRVSSRSTTAAGTFSNSKVTTSQVAARVFSASTSS